MLDDEVRSHIQDVIQGTTSIDDFTLWFVQRTWDDRSPLVAKVSHLLAERDLLSEAEFTTELGRLASGFTMAGLGAVTVQNMRVVADPVPTAVEVSH